MTVPTISPAEFKERNVHEIDVVDVRTPVEFQEMHLPGTRNVPLDRLEPAEVMQSRKHAGTLYVLCRSGSRGKKACERLQAAGYADVVNVEGGILACAEAGLPMERGRKVMSLERQVRIAAGALVLLGIGLGFTVHAALFGIAAFVGAGLMFAGITDTCGMGLLLARMPWNRVEAKQPESCPITRPANRQSA